MLDDYSFRIRIAASDSKKRFPHRQAEREQALLHMTHVLIQMLPQQFDDFSLVPLVYKSTKCIKSCF